MKTIRPVKRSVSPFVLAGDVPSSSDLSPLENKLVELRVVLVSTLGPSPSNVPSTFKSLDDLHGFPHWIHDMSEAPANDAPRLLEMCQSLIRFQETLHQKGLAEPIHQTMVEFFLSKIQLFMIDHYDEEHCKKMGWALDHKDVILFSKERDILIGSYFAPLADAQPGRFSEFISRWMNSENRDQVLHFLDFCSGSKNPTFEHYLLFSHPALGRILRDKAFLKSLFEKSDSLLKKLTSPTWEKETRSALGL